MKKIFFTFWTFIVLTAITQAVEIQDTAQAINVAGKQRMLTQRMMADYVLIGMHSNFKDPKGDLIKAIDAFDAGLKAIGTYSKSNKVQQLLAEEQKLWTPAKEKLIKEPSTEVCKTLCVHLDKLLGLSNDIVVEIKKESGATSSKIIDMSGRQRMLSQRIAGLYILNLWDKGNSTYKENLDKAMALFKKSMAELKEYDKNTEEIKGLISKVEKSYHYFEMMNSMDSSMGTMPSLVYKKLDEMLVNMDKVTHLYADMK